MPFDSRNLHKSSEARESSSTGSSGWGSYRACARDGTGRLVLAWCAEGPAKVRRECGLQRVELRHVTHQQVQACNAGADAKRIATSAFGTDQDCQARGILRGWMLSAKTCSGNADASQSRFSSHLAAAPRPDGRRTAATTRHTPAPGPCRTAVMAVAGAGRHT